MMAMPVMMVMVTLRTAMMTMNDEAVRVRMVTLMIMMAVIRRWLSPSLGPQLGGQGVVGGGGEWGDDDGGARGDNG